MIRTKPTAILAAWLAIATSPAAAECSRWGIGVLQWTQTNGYHGRFDCRNGVGFYQANGGGGPEHEGSISAGIDGTGVTINTEWGGVYTGEIGSDGISGA